MCSEKEFSIIQIFLSNITRSYGKGAAELKAETIRLLMNLLIKRQLIRYHFNNLIILVIN